MYKNSINNPFKRVGLKITNTLFLRPKIERRNKIEHSALFRSLSPNEIYERKLIKEQLHAAIATLSDKQAKRIYAHYFLDMTKVDIAKAEGASPSIVKDAIGRGLRNLEKYKKNNI